MLGDITVADEIYIVTNYTDMRKSIDGLCAVVEDQLKMDPRRSALYLFCGKLRVDLHNSENPCTILRCQCSDNAHSVDTEGCHRFEICLNARSAAAVGTGDR